MPFSPVSQKIFILQLRQLGRNQRGSQSRNRIFWFFWTFDLIKNQNDIIKSTFTGKMASWNQSCCNDSAPDDKSKLNFKSNGDYFGFLLSLVICVIVYWLLSLILATLGLHIVYTGSTCPKFGWGPGKVRLSLFATGEKLPGLVCWRKAWFTCVLPWQDGKTWPRDEAKRRVTVSEIKSTRERWWFFWS